MGSALLARTWGLLICFYLCKMWVCGMVPPAMNQCNYLCSWWDKNDKEQKCTEYMWSFKWFRLLRAVSSSEIFCQQKTYMILLFWILNLLEHFKWIPRSNGRKLLKFAQTHSFTKSGISQNLLSFLIFFLILLEISHLHLLW